MGRSTMECEADELRRKLAKLALAASALVTAAVILLGLLLLLLYLAADIPPTRQAIVGYYIGRYAGGEEIFVILQDGTYSQTFNRDGHALYTNRGRWEIHEGAVRFWDFTVIADCDGEPLKETSHSLAFDASWCQRDNGIEFGDRYRIVKRPEPSGE